MSRAEPPAPVYARRTQPQVLCHACGYAPEDHEHPPHRCPKCNGGCWERFVRMGRIRSLLYPAPPAIEVPAPAHAPAHAGVAEIQA